MSTIRRKLRGWARRAAARLRPPVWTLGASGLALIAYGVHEIHRPSGLVAAGLACVAMEWRLADDR